MSSFSLVKLKDTAIVKIIDIESDEVIKDSAGNEMYIEIYSADSKKYRKNLASIVKENETKKSTKKNNDEIMTDILAASIASWNIELEDGNVPLTIANATYILDENRFIRDMLLETVNDRKIFLQK